MAKETQPGPRQRRAAPKAAQKAVRKRPVSRKPKQKQKRVRRHIYPEFKPDQNNISPLKMLHFTQVQRDRLTRWSLYIAVCLLCLVVQDTIMSRVSILGSTTDLCVGAMLIITVIEGSDVGSVFILFASMIYYFSGSAPGPYSVGTLSVYGLLASLFRQQVWHRNGNSILLCSSLAVLAYEITLYAVGLFLGLTRWYRFPRFVITAALTVLAMVPLYKLINAIGQIGGNTWKE